MATQRSLSPCLQSHSCLNFPQAYSLFRTRLTLLTSSSTRLLQFGQIHSCIACVM